MSNAAGTRALILFEWLAVVVIILAMGRCAHHIMSIDYVHSKHKHTVQDDRPTTKQRTTK